jgi:diguanylate cyclase (GGDEF)-like protein
VGRSLRLPLARLEQRASEVLGGATTMAPLPINGPREVRVVSRAVNVFVSNLATVEQQAAALADADLDNPVHAQPASGALGEALHRTFARLTDAMQAQAELGQQLSHDARHDALTGLPNRVAAHEAVGAALHRAERTGSQVALLFVDLDGFKQVNDLHGHGVGDEVLRRTVRRMAAVGRGGDLLARLGGDEFVVVAEPIGDIAEAVIIAERLIAAVSEPLDVDDARVGIGASVGIALGSRVADATTLVTDADLAVYQAKAAGRGRVEVYDRVLREELESRTALEADLRAAIAGHGLSLHYQPIVRSVGRDVGGVEALLRWDRPGHGRVPPAEFIPVAETSALIVDIGRWVLHEAASQWVSWQDDPDLAGLHVSVNVSARHLLSKGFVADVRQALATTGMDPTALIIELTETALLTDLPQASASLGELRAMGIGVALDDFGTGHTSFAYLRHLPIDAIKIDRSYIAGLDDPTDEALTGLMSAMARVLEVDVVAEGVEHAAQLDALTGLGCGLAQGFHICHPLPPEEVEDWIRARGGRSRIEPAIEDAFIAD